MISAHEKIVHHLITTVSIPDRVDHVKVLVSELQRISILWDELWFNSIQQYSTEVAKRVKKMEDEAEKLKKNDTLRSDFSLSLNNLPGSDCYFLVKLRHKCPRLCQVGSSLTNYP